MIKLKDLISERRNLYVFDFDDTLVKSTAFIKVKKKSGEIVKLTPEQYAKYVKETGDEFDYSDFNNAIIQNPQPIGQNINSLRSVFNNPQNKVTILTARGLVFPVRYYFKKAFGFEPYVVGLGDSDPTKKSDWIENHIKKGYKNIFFIDDSEKNVLAVRKLKSKYPNVNLRAIHHK